MWLTYFYRLVHGETRAELIMNNTNDVRCTLHNVVNDIQTVNNTVQIGNHTHKPTHACMRAHYHSQLIPLTHAQETCTSRLAQNVHV